ncbi:MAG: SprT family zinc-dependent metalloprotease [Chloroflexota bacterium]
MAREGAESLQLWGNLVPKAEFVIRRSPKARRVRLQVTDEGEALIVMPLRASEREATDLFNRHRDWVAKQQAKVEERRIRLATRPSLAAGRVLMVNGLARKVRVSNQAERDALERQLRKEARAAIAASIALRAPQMEVKPGTLQIRDQKSRWGSASRRGGLSFSWRLILAPVDILDYVVVHELAHLRHGGHGKRFWSLVEKHYGDHRAARKWLRDHNDEIRQALD